MLDKSVDFKMERKTYISDEFISLSEYIDSEDVMDFYACWQDEDTQRGYNYKMVRTFDEFSKSPVRSRFISTITRNSDGANLGIIFLSPEDALPDLAIMIYKPYRKSGYGTGAFSLGVKYCFEVLKLDCIYAGCFPHNTASFSMLKKCGFQPHPEGNVAGKHYLTGKDIIQLDFVKYST